MFGYGKREIEVLVIGAAHIDTIVERESLRSGQYRDSPGKVFQSVGGGGYNIAVNLADDRHIPRGAIALYTLLPRSSVFSAPIVRRLARARVNTRYVQKIDRIGDEPVYLGGYVAVRDLETQDIHLAVTSTCIDRLNPFADARQENLIERLLKSARFVVIDTNLTAVTIDRILHHCAGTPPVFVQIVSDAKASRYSRSARSAPAGWAHGLFGKADEVVRALEDMGADPAKTGAFGEELLKGAPDPLAFGANEVCTRLRARNVLCTTHATSWLFSMGEGGGATWRLSPPRSVAERYYRGNLTGVGDATAAAFVALHIRRRMAAAKGAAKTSAFTPVDFSREEEVDALTAEVHRYVEKVVDVRGATRHSGISDDQKELRTVVDLVRGFIIEHWEWFALIGVAGFLALANWLGADVVSGRH